MFRVGTSKTAEGRRTWKWDEVGLDRYLNDFERVCVYVVVYVVVYVILRLSLGES